MKIPKRYAHTAIESTGRRLVDLRDGKGRESTVNLKKADGYSAAEKEAVEGFFARSLVHDGGLNQHPGVQFEEIDATLQELHQELRAVDLNGDGIDEAEQAQMSKAGRLAMALAEDMMATQPVEAMAAQQLEGLSPQDAMAVVRKASVGHVELGYNVARAIMFAHIDNQGGQVDGVYLDQQLDDVSGIPDANVMNTEHSWPKARGVKELPAMSDLHHLFPAGKEINTRRATYPFGIVETVTWEGGDSKLGHDKAGQLVFEPPQEHKGDIARALFYVANTYELEFPQGEPEVLLRWHREDPADPQEQTRNEDISRFQGNRNPFVDNPDLADLLVSSLQK